MSVAIEEGSNTVLNSVEERCDRCGARGYVKVGKKDLRLIFCNHHGREFGAELTAQGWIQAMIVIE